jgi:hypothetical protein
MPSGRFRESRGRRPRRDAQTPVESNNVKSEAGDRGEFHESARLEH